MKTTIIMILLVISQMVIGQTADEENASKQKLIANHFAKEIGGQISETLKSENGNPIYRIAFPVQVNFNAVELLVDHLVEKYADINYTSEWEPGETEEDNFYVCFIDAMGFSILMAYVIDDNNIDLMFISDQAVRE